MLEPPSVKSYLEHSLDDTSSVVGLNEVVDDWSRGGEEWWHTDSQIISLAVGTLHIICPACNKTFGMSV